MTSSVRFTHGITFEFSFTISPVGDAAQEMDDAVGQIMAAAKLLDLDEDIVWFFTSDNGAPLFNDDFGNGPLRDGKTTTWEGGIREPAAIRWAGHIEPGRISDELAGTYDIFPTMLSLVRTLAWQYHTFLEPTGTGMESTEL